MGNIHQTSRRASVRQRGVGAHLDGAAPADPHRVARAGARCRTPEGDAGGAVGGWDITRGAILKGFGAMFFVASGGTDARAAPDRVELNGNAQVLLTAPGPEGGDYEGVSFSHARWNTATAVLHGTGRVDEGIAFEAGCLYFPESKIEVGGTNDITLNQLIADQIEAYGTGTRTINYNGDVPAEGPRVFLVR